MDLQRYFDRMFMAQALAFAKKAWGSTGINPRVGALIVKNNRLISQGYHRRLGEAHAEICALAGAGEKARGATLYVNLEPCCCSGRTPPCVATIVKAGISRVVIGMTDPNPLVDGKGIEYLKKHNIEVTTGIMEREARELNIWYRKYITTKIPYVIMKIATSRDGKISGSAQKYITSEQSRRLVHGLRGQLNAVLIGINTLLSDNPYLNDRLVGKNNPARIVIDPHLKIPEQANFLVPDSRRLIITNKKNDEVKISKLSEKGVEFVFFDNAPYSTCEILKELGKKSVSAVLVEGGGEVFAEFFSAGDYDEIYLFQAKKDIRRGLALKPEILNYAQTRDRNPTKIGEDLLYHVYRNN